MSEIALFSNDEFRLEITPHETDGFRVLAPPVARHLGFRDAARMLETVPAAEKGYTLASTPGGEQRVSYLTEKGFFRVLGQRQAARVQDPAARVVVERFQDWVYGEVLPALRRGELIPAQRTAPAVPDLATPEGVLAMAELFQQTARRLVASERRVAELEPAAESWEHMADATGDYSLRDAAHILSRDPDIEIGQKRLAKLLRDLGWIDQRTMRPYQVQIANGRLSARVSVFTDDEGEQHTKYQARVRPKGLHALRGHLSGVKPLQLRLALLDGGEAS
jgi:prophage antirepressor-like protein